MSTIEEDLVTTIAALGGLTISTVAVNSVPEQFSEPYIWLRRAASEEALDMNGAGGLTETRFDLESVATAIATSIGNADVIKAGLHGLRGDIGTNRYQGIFVDDKNDDYIPRGDGGDLGKYVTALELTCWHST